MTNKPLTVSEMARLGGHARAKKMTAQQRKESARNAVNARWDKQKREVEQSLDGVKRAGSGLREDMKTLRKVRKAGERLLKKAKGK
jgi:hypothetical protein